MHGVEVRLQMHTKVFLFIAAYGGKFLKRIIINLPPTKDNEINIFLTDVQNHVSYTGSYKRFLIHFGLCFETAGNVF